MIDHRDSERWLVQCPKEFEGALGIAGKGGHLSAAPYLTNDRRTLTDHPESGFKIVNTRDRQSGELPETVAQNYVGPQAGRHEFGGNQIVGQIYCNLVEL